MIRDEGGSVLIRAKRVSNDDERVQEEGLRFSVYSKLGWIDAGAFPQRLETDIHDDHASRFVALDERGEIVGCMRVIYGSNGPLPAVSHFGLADTVVDSCEVSRLIVHPRARSHSIEIILRLCGLGFREAQVAGCRRAFAIMEPRLLRLVNAVGFPFEALTDVRSVFGGLTCACSVDLAAIEASFRRRSALTGIVGVRAAMFESPSELTVTSASPTKTTA